MLFDLLNQAELADEPLLHISVHVAVAINMPFVPENNSEIKQQHLNRANCMVFDLKSQKHVGGDFQGCLLAIYQEKAGN